MTPQIMPQDLVSAPRSLEPACATRCAASSARTPSRTGSIPSVFLGSDHGVVHLAAPTSFIGTWVSRNYGDTIRQLLCKNGVAISRLDFSVAPAAGGAPRAEAPVARGRRRAPPGHAPRRRPPRLAARRALHLRQLRRRQAERARPRRRPPRGRGRHRWRPGHLQPAFPLRRGRPRQDPPHARHRLGGEAAEPRGAGALPLRRAVHVPLRLGAALQGHARLQGDVPLGRHADGRRRAVHLRQGLRPRRSSSTPSTR